MVTPISVNGTGRPTLNDFIAVGTKIKMNQQRYKKKIRKLLINSVCGFAEREGFEPPAPLSASVFKTGAFDHSAISPKVRPQGFEPWTL